MAVLTRMEGIREAAGRLMSTEPGSAAEHHAAVELKQRIMRTALDTGDPHEREQALAALMHRPLPWVF